MVLAEGQRTSKAASCCPLVREVYCIHLNVIAEFVGQKIIQKAWAEESKHQGIWAFKL